MSKKYLKYLLIILSPLAVLYSVVINFRNFLFNNGIFREEKVKAKIISVGNLTVGGSGKTPTVIYIIKLLKKNNVNVGVLSRGYGRNSKGFKLVSDGSKILLSVIESGDEIVQVAEECKVPAAVSEKRVLGAKKLITEIGVDVIVLDDAYQHRWIARDLDILIFDQRFLMKRDSIEQKPLPLGRMREPFSAINRADLILINRKFNDKRELSKSFKELVLGKKVYYGSYKASGLIDVKSEQLFSLHEFEGQKSLVVCGIARPFSFLKILEDSKIDITNRMLFKDHKEYDLKEVQQIRKKFYDTNSYSVITTEKDFVKLKSFAKELDDIDIYYLKIDLQVENEEEFNKEILNIIN
ncbi:MAG: tetraacyldisaccharide 4'-kinase [Bacteroidetes bacterium]|nr:tetraacyldisaccharide 4'-kinase [Bacteroidota bacterium]MBU1799980.1 tetraacyldisaccharide 4'-kinase [Bacteroidota bacterium]